MKDLSATGRHKCSMVENTLEAQDLRNNSIFFLPIQSNKRFMLLSASVCISTDADRASSIPIYVDLFEMANALKDIKDQMKLQVNKKNFCPFKYIILLNLFLFCKNKVSKWVKRRLISA